MLEDRVIRPDGRPGVYSTVQVKPGVAVLPIDRDGDVYLVRQFRYALGCESLEAVCGGVEEGETFQASAKKELREEVGIEASAWTDLGFVDLDTSMVRCKMGLFLAEGLSFTETEREGTETMQTVMVPFQEALRQGHGGRDHPRGQLRPHPQGGQAAVAVRYPGRRMGVEGRGEGFDIEILPGNGQAGPFAFHASGSYDGVPSPAEERRSVHGPGLSLPSTRAAP